MTARDAGDTAGAATSADPVTVSLLAARDGDQLAATAFVRETQFYVRRFIAGLTHWSVADDLTQDTYLRAFRALPDYAGRSNAQTWLLAIARHTCADYVRGIVRQRRLSARVATDHDRTPPVDLTTMVETTDLLRRLSAERRVALVLTQVLGLSYDEAAAVEGIPVGTIRSRVARGRADLIAALNVAKES